MKKKMMAAVLAAVMAVGMVSVCSGLRRCRQQDTGGRL